MHEQQFKELWEMRFMKILELEKESSLFYARLLRRNKTILAGVDLKAKIVLERILTDRPKRTRCASELVRLIKQKVLSEKIAK